ncbi:31191_t:CDS:1, partial [Racocetra persica]
MIAENFSTHKNGHIFYNNFPYIKTIRRISNKNYWRAYKVIKLGHYPSISRFTRKQNNIVYQILDKYEIETSLAGLSVRYKTQYQQASYINYTISCINQNGNTVSCSSATSATNIGIEFLK